jgi:lipopolysaccharide export system permease protein
MILHFYFARRFLMSFLMLVFVFFALVTLVDMIEQARKFRSLDEVGFAEIFQLTLLNTPQTMNQILPLIMILSTVVLFLGLARSSELVVTRAAGRSALRALLAPVAVALIIGGLAVTVFNPIAAATTNRYKELANHYRSDGAEAFSISSEGLWLRQGSQIEQTVIRASRANGDASILYDVSFITFEPNNGAPTRRIEASSAQLFDGEWELRKAKVWTFVTDANTEASAEYHDTLALGSTLTLDRIQDSMGTRTSTSIWDMPHLITQLQRAGFSSRRHQVWYQVELAQPLFLIAMVLMSAAFTMRHTRFGGTGIAVLSAVLCGFGLYFVRNFAQILGENGQLPILLAAWAPPAAAIMLALGLLLHAEDG